LSTAAATEPNVENVEDEARMSLMEHLSELRSRLFKITLTVLGLGAASLYFAKEIFGFLMRPVLQALPADMPSLVYTSAIEEINVLLKVGMYAGVFLTTPVILYQLWGFVAPGLYAHERKYAAPFVVLGTVAFLIGAAFCYFTVLPTMFQFLLQEGESAALEQRIGDGALREEEALRFVRLGDAATAATLAKNADVELAAPGEGQAAAEVSLAEGTAELKARIAGLGRLVDATLDGYGADARPVVRQVMETRLAAITASRRTSWIRRAPSWRRRRRCWPRWLRRARPTSSSCGSWRRTWRWGRRASTRTTGRGRC
jgi:sec-independent protein translocase protein TatC